MGAHASNGIHTDDSSAATADSEHYVAPRPDDALACREVAPSSPLPPGEVDLNEELRHKNERIEQLEQLLEEEKQRAEASDKLQTVFMDNMSHEFRTPLNGILGMTQLIRSLPITPEVRDYVETIEQSGHHLASLVDRILDYLQLSTQGAHLETEPFLLEDCLNEVIHPFIKPIYKKGLELIVDYDLEDPFEIESDPKRVRQIIEILLENAVKFTDAGYIAVEVITRPASLPKDGLSHPIELIISVTDTGIGIPEEHLDLIFMPFRQLDGSMSRTVGGVGMGLSLCKEIVGFMGGALDVQSKLGYGSTFTVTLPALYEASASVHPLAALEAGVLGVVAYHEVIQRTVSRMTANWGLKPVAWNLAGRSLRLPDADVWFVEYQADATHTAHVARTILNHAAPERPVMIAMLPPGTTLAPADKALFDVVIEKPLRRKALHEALHFGLLSQPASGEDAEGTYTEATERQIRLLMIEPNRINQKILARMLENLDVTVDTAMALDEIAAEWPNRGYDAILVNAASHSQASLDELREFAWSVQKPGGPRLIALLTGESKITSEMLRAAGISHQLMMPVNLEAMREALGLDH